MLWFGLVVYRGPLPVGVSCLAWLSCTASRQPVTLNPSRRHPHPTPHVRLTYLRSCRNRLETRNTRRAAIKRTRRTAARQQQQQEQQQQEQEQGAPQQQERRVRRTKRRKKAASDDEYTARTEGEGSGGADVGCDADGTPPDGVAAPLDDGNPTVRPSSGGATRRAATAKSTGPADVVAACDRAAAATSGLLRHHDQPDPQHQHRHRHQHQQEEHCHHHERHPEHGQNAATAEMAPPDVTDADPHGEPGLLMKRLSSLARGSGRPAASADGSPAAAAPAAPPLLQAQAQPQPQLPPEPRPQQWRPSAPRDPRLGGSADASPALARQGSFGSYTDQAQRARVREGAGCGDGAPVEGAREGLQVQYPAARASSGGGEHGGERGSPALLRQSQRLQFQRQQQEQLQLLQQRQQQQQQQQWQQQAQEQEQEEFQWQQRQQQQQEQEQLSWLQRQQHQEQQQEQLSWQQHRQQQQQQDHQQEQLLWQQHQQLQQQQDHQQEQLLWQQHQQLQQEQQREQLLRQQRQEEQQRRQEATHQARRYWAQSPGASAVSASYPSYASVPSCRLQLPPAPSPTRFKPLPLLTTCGGSVDAMLRLLLQELVRDGTDTWAWPYTQPGADNPTAYRARAGGSVATRAAEARAVPHGAYSETYAPAGGPPPGYLQPRGNGRAGAIGQHQLPRPQPPQQQPQLEAAAGFSSGNRVGRNGSDTQPGVVRVQVRGSRAWAPPAAAQYGVHPGW